jgi:tRNA A-37 threonylcarbamoyl transferase component Bud32
LFLTDMQNNMSGRQLNWVLADDFKDQVTPAALAALADQAGKPAAVAAGMELRSGSGLRARSCADLFLKYWETARALQARGIALRRPIAIGCRRSMGFIRAAYLIIETLPGSMQLKDFLDRHGPRPESLNLPANTDLIDIFAAFAAQLRKVCILSTGFHLGDVLIRIAPDGSPCLYLADVDKLELKHPGAGHRRIDNLRMLDAVLWGRAPSRAQLLFMQMYLSRLADWRETLLRLGRRLADMLKELRVIPSGNAQGEDMRRLAAHGLRGCMKQGEHEEALLKLLEAPDTLFNRPDVVILKNSPTTSALLLQTPELPWPVYIKRYNPKGSLFALRYLLRRSRAQRAWQTARNLCARHIPTPEPLAFQDRRPCGFLQASYLVTRALAGADGLDRYVEKHFPAWPIDTKRAFLGRLAGLLKAAHGHGMMHGDLKAKNILVESGCRAGEQFLFIDLDATQVRASAPFFERYRDLARLNCSFLNTALVSRTHRLFFLRCYVADNPQAELRVAWKTVLNFSWRKLLKSGREFN